MCSTSKPSFSRWLVVFGGLFPAAVVFGPVLFSDEVLAFRDIQHYYMPLLKTVHDQWQAGHLPLWNPLEERGRPLLADPTASVWYPGQLVFWLPIPFATSLKLYIAGHVLLAYVTMYVAACRLRLAPVAATLASVSYAFGGSILFQCCNPPYLIGAAWLPLGISSTYETITCDHRASRATLAFVLSMMVTGGDPQTAYLLGLVGCFGALLAWLPVRSQCGATRGILKSLTRLALAGTLAIGFSAAQWVPSIEWTLRSERVADQPATEVTADSETNASVWKSPAHAARRYDFSVGPWRWVELLWPNAAGKPFPQNSRWMSLIPSEARYWTPTLYMGLLPVLLALAALRLRSGRLMEKWLTWVLLIAILACCGRYGLGWAVNQLAIGSHGARAAIPDEVGGLYWLFVQLVPGFGLFRYPAKLWTWCAAAMSLLAGQRLNDRLHQDLPVFSRPILIVHFVASSFVLVLLTALKPWFGGIISHFEAREDLLFGPLQSELVWYTLVPSICHGAIISGVGLVLISRNSTSRVPLAGLLVVVITAAELGFAHRWLAPHAREVTVAKDDHDFAVRGRVLRQQPQSWYPETWRRTTSVSRLEDCLRWDRLTAKPKYPQLDGWDSLESTTSFSSLDQAALMRVIYDVRANSPERFVELLQRLGVTRYVGGPRPALPDLIPVNRSQASMSEFAADYQSWHTPAPHPGAWSCFRSLRIDPMTSRDLDVIAQLTSDLLQRNDADYRRRVAIEALPDEFRAATHPSLDDQASPATDLNSPCEIVARTPSHLTLEVNLRASSWVVVNEAYDPGWRATRHTRGQCVDLRVFRANRVMRAVYVPSGVHQIHFDYRPTSVYAGLATSISVLVGCAMWAFATMVNRARTNNQQP